MMRNRDIPKLFICLNTAGSTSYFQRRRTWNRIISTFESKDL